MDKFVRKIPRLEVKLLRSGRSGSCRTNVAAQVKFVMKWRCYNRYLWFEIERNLSPPDAFYGIFYVQNPFVAGAPPRTPLGELTALPQIP